MNAWLAAVGLLAGCTAPGTNTPGTGASTSSDADPAGDTDVDPTDADPTGGDTGPTADSGADTAVPDTAPILDPCPTSGDGAIVAPGSCVVFTAEQAGAAAEGDNATVANYALGPDGSARDTLVVELNGSLGSPAGQIADPDVNLLSTLAADGFHVIALAYKSTNVLGVLCARDPDCFDASRSTVVTGILAPGAPLLLRDVRADEGIVARLEAALVLLDAAQPNAGWGAFLGVPGDPDPARRIAWDRVIASGHSQGGGHAAYLGKLFALRRVVQLSSTCDANDDVPAPWTDGSVGAWATPPASFVGFAAPTAFDALGEPIDGDTTCPYHAAVWANLGMAAANQHDDAVACGFIQDTHGASLLCEENAAAWPSLYE